MLRAIQICAAKTAPCKRFSARQRERRRTRANLGRPTVVRFCGLFGRSTGPRHRRVAICVAVAIESLLAGTEGRNPPVDLVAQVAMADWGETGGKDVGRAPG